jgi:co-chaperonin GroES (HSP10)
MRPAYSPTRINNLRALKDTVLVTDMVFKERKLNSGLILPSDNGTSLGIRPRWGRVFAVGPEQTAVTVGQWICVAHGRWTRGVEIQDESGTNTIRKIDPKDILLVSDEEPNDTTMSEAVHIAAKST